MSGTVIVDYETLKTRITEMLRRPDLVDEAESFIQMAEDDISGDIDHPRGIDTIVLTADDKVAVPLDYRRVINMTCIAQSPDDSGSVVGLGPVDWVPQLDFDDRTAYGGPGGRIYTITGDNFLFAPGLSQAKVRLVYKRRLDALGYSNPSNWILANYPSLYLYAALKASCLRVVEDERLGLWDSMYQACLERVNRSAIDHTTPVFTKLAKRKVV